MIEKFKTMVKDLGIELNEEQLDQFDTYYRELVEWNKKINLTAITDLEGVYTKHFYDSLTMNKAVDFHSQTLLDVGSGAGFPSIPLKIVYPDLDVTIVDSLNKRIVFLKELTKKLNVKATLIHGRVEELDTRNHYDIVTARAVANLRVLGELCIPFVKKDGLFISFKGPKYIEELKLCDNLLSKLNTTVENVIEYHVGDSFRALLIFKKEKESALKYPRRFGFIKSNPL